MKPQLASPSVASPLLYQKAQSSSIAIPSGTLQVPWRYPASSTIGTANPPAVGPQAAVAVVFTVPVFPNPKTCAKKSCCWDWYCTLR